MEEEIKTLSEQDSRPRTFGSEGFPLIEAEGIPAEGIPAEGTSAEGVIGETPSVTPLPSQVTPRPERWLTSVPERFRLRYRQFQEAELHRKASEPWYADITDEAIILGQSVVKGVLLPIDILFNRPWRMIRESAMAAPEMVAGVGRFEGMPGFLGEERINLIMAQAILPEVFGSDLLTPQGETARKMLKHVGFSRTERAFLAPAFFVSELLFPGPIVGAGVKKGMSFVTKQTLLVDRLGITFEEAGLWLKNKTMPESVFMKLSNQFANTIIDRIGLTIKTPDELFARLIREGKTPQEAEKMVNKMFQIKKMTETGFMKPITPPTEAVQRGLGLETKGAKPVWTPELKETYLLEEGIAKRRGMTIEQVRNKYSQITNPKEYLEALRQEHQSLISPAERATAELFKEAKPMGKTAIERHILGEGELDILALKNEITDIGEAGVKDIIQSSQKGGVLYDPASKIHLQLYRRGYIAVEKIGAKSYLRATQQGEELITRLALNKDNPAFSGLAKLLPEETIKSAVTVEAKGVASTIKEAVRQRTEAVIPEDELKRVSNQINRLVSKISRDLMESDIRYTLTRQIIRKGVIPLMKIVEGKGVGFSQLEEYLTAVPPYLRNFEGKFLDETYAVIEKLEGKEAVKLTRNAQRKYSSLKANRIEDIVSQSKNWGIPLDDIADFYEKIGKLPKTGALDKWFYKDDAINLVKQTRPELFDLRKKWMIVNRVLGNALDLIKGLPKPADPQIDAYNKILQSISNQVGGDVEKAVKIFQSNRLFTQDIAQMFKTGEITAGQAVNEVARKWNITPNDLYQIYLTDLSRGASLMGKIGYVAKGVYKLAREYLSELRKIKKGMEKQALMGKELEKFFSKLSPDEYRKLEEFWRSQVGKQITMFPAPTISELVEFVDKLEPEKWGNFRQALLPIIEKHIAEQERLLVKIGRISPTLSDMYMTLWRRADNFRRAMMVGQLTTAVRNAVVQTGMIGMSAIDDAMESSISAIIGKRPLRLGEIAADYWGAIVSRFDESQRKRLLEILDSQPSQKLRFFSAPVQDVFLTDKISRLINTPNRLQEMQIRSIFLHKRLTELLAPKNLTVMTAKISDITTEMLQDAVRYSLQNTFAYRFSNKTLGGKILSVWERLPFPMTLVQPFPRFYVNSLDFIYRHSPLGLLDLLSPAHARSTTRIVAEATTGLGMLAGAFAVRSSSMAGEKWYEIRTPWGTIDVRPFAPFSSYLFIANLFLHPERLNRNDVFQAVIGINPVVGTGQVLVDAVGNLLVPQKRESAFRLLERTVREYLGGFSVPLRTLRDIMAGIEMGAGIPARETEAVGRASERIPVIGGFIDNIPYFRQLLPEANRLTRYEPYYAEYPILRQLSGVRLYTKTPLEQEINRLGIEEWRLLPRVPQKEQNIIKKEMSWYVEMTGNKLLNSSAYINATDKEKRDMILKFFGGIRTKIKSSPEVSMIYKQIADEERIEELLKHARTPEQEEQIKLLGNILEKKRNKNKDKIHQQQKIIDKNRQYYYEQYQKAIEKKREKKNAS